MNKRNKPFEPVVTAELLGKIAEVLDMASRNRYSAKAVYGAYNEVMGRNDRPETCATCLRNRVRELRKWYDSVKPLPESVVNWGVHVQPDDPTAPSSEGDGVPPGVLFQTPGERPDGEPDPSGDADERPDVLPIGVQLLGDALGVEEGEPVDVTRLHIAALPLPVYFAPGDKDPKKGRAFMEGNVSIKPGKYEASDGRELAVQPGGKATLKDAPDNDLL